MSQRTKRRYREKKKPSELRIPVATEEEDDGGLFEDELLDEDLLESDDIEEVEDVEEIDEDISFVKATKEQEMAGRLFQERKLRLDAMQQVANLENEIATLRKEVAETRIQKLRDQAAAIENANARMFADCGLNEGDQLKPHENGFIVIPKGKE